MIIKKTYFRIWTALWMILSLKRYTYVTFYMLQYVKRWNCNHIRSSVVVEELVSIEIIHCKFELLLYHRMLRLSLHNWFWCVKIWCETSHSQCTGAVLDCYWIFPEKLSRVLHIKIGLQADRGNRESCGRSHFLSYITIHSHIGNKKWLYT